MNKNHYSETTLTLEDLNAQKTWIVLEFGANECGICQAKRAQIDAAIAEIRAQAINFNYHAIQDGKGKKLGRQFQVKLWPSLIFLHDGAETFRLVRPDSTQEILDACRLHRII